MDFDIRLYLQQRGKLRFYAHGLWEVKDCLQFSIRRDEPPCEIKAVFTCTKVNGPGAVNEAVVKVRLQYPIARDSSDRKQARKPTKKLYFESQNELFIMKRLSKAGCPHTATLLGHFQEPQGPKGCLPHGYALYMLMTRLPGKSPLWFWNDGFWNNDSTIERRDQLREDFNAAYFDFYQNYGITMKDAALRNLVWDEDNRKCYFVDFEDASIDWSDYEQRIHYIWWHWGLLKGSLLSSNTGEITWQY